MNAEFSVLMSVYEKERPEWLRAALDSVFAQTCPPAEVLVMEDGPLTPELYGVLEEYRERYPQLRTVALEDHQYLGRALARGVEECRYDLIARMDTDDVARPERFALQTAYMREHPEIAASGGYIEEFGEENEARRVKTMPLSPEEVRRYARYRNPLNHMTVMMRRRAVLESGNYRHFLWLEDYDLWARMLSRGYRLGNVPEVLVEARTGETFYRRRGGTAYFRQYVKHRRNQRREGLLNAGEYLISLALSFGMTMQPPALRGIAYRRLLRKAKTKERDLR